jgi:imidazolonepropionase-like amidohydrolase
MQDIMSEGKPRLIIKSGNVFDALNGRMKANHTICISGNRIQWCGEDSAYDGDPSDEIIDASGKTILPGLIDCHVHLPMTGKAQYEREFLRTNTVMWYYYALHHAQKHLVSGFTCVRDCGGRPEWGPSLRRIFANGVLAGPRILVANSGIIQWGYQEAVGPIALIEYDRKYIEVKTGVDGVKHAVRECKHSGSDFIKTIITGGVLHGITSQLDTSFFLDEELEAMREEAHRIGMHVACHAHGRTGIYRAVKAGIDTIEHGTFLDEETADLMVQNQTYLIPTQMSSFGITNSEIMKQLPSEVIEKENQAQQSMLENHKMAFNKGVLIATGTDAGTPGNYHGTSAGEIKCMVENVGMTTTQALQAATIQAAKAIQMDNQIGSIDEGKLADLVICDNNPLEDVSILQNSLNLSYVIKDGLIMAERGKITYFK